MLGNHLLIQELSEQFQTNLTPNNPTRQNIPINPIKYGLHSF